MKVAGSYASPVLVIRPRVTSWLSRVIVVSSLAPSPTDASRLPRSAATSSSDTVSARADTLRPNEAPISNWNSTSVPWPLASTVSPSGPRSSPVTTARIWSAGSVRPNCEPSSSWLAVNWIGTSVSIGTPSIVRVPNATVAGLPPTVTVIPSGMLENVTLWVSLGSPPVSRIRVVWLAFGSPDTTGIIAPLRSAEISVSSPTKIPSVAWSAGASAAAVTVVVIAAVVDLAVNTLPSAVSALEPRPKL